MKEKQLTEGNSFLLDLIRAISVQMVVVGHGLNFCPSRVSAYLQPPYFPWIQSIAVVIFFILSGYLISNSIFQKLTTDPGYSFRSYLIDRFSRIYSAFIPALLFILLIDFISKSISPELYSYHNAFDGKTFIGNLFMLQDFPFLKYLHVKITSFGSARPLWTLAIEWWIYLWFGILMIRIFKKKFSISTIIWFVFLSIVPAYNLINGRGHGLTLFWLFGVFIGIGYDKFKNFQLSAVMKWGLLVLLLVLAGLRVRMTGEEYDFVFAFFLAGALLIGMELCSALQVNQKISKIVKFIAGYSYTLYLIHYSIYDFLTINFKNNFGSYSMLFMGFFVSNLLSIAIGYYTETKLTKSIKRKLRTKFT